MDYLGVLGKHVQPAGYPVVETRAYGNNQVGAHDTVIGISRPMHSQHAQRLFVRRGERAYAHQGPGHRGLYFIRQKRQALRSAGRNHAAAHIKDRLF